MADDRPPQIKAGNWTERESKNGGTYITGWLGPIKATLLPSKFEDKWGNKQWSLILSENPPKRTDEEEPRAKQKPKEDALEKELKNGRRGRKASW
jgi:hypothetical protein